MCLKQCNCFEPTVKCLPHWRTGVGHREDEGAVELEGFVEFIVEVPSGPLR